MPAVKETVCRNAKCSAKATVYIDEEGPPPSSGFYVFNCPRCGKHILFPANGLQKIGGIPPDAIIARAFE